jgi:hypothetical protein
MVACHVILGHAPAGEIVVDIAVEGGRISRSCCSASNDCASIGPLTRRHYRHIVLPLATPSAADCLMYFLARCWILKDANLWLRKRGGVRAAWET